MITYVEIHSLDEVGKDIVEGRIIWNGKALRADPPGKPLLNGILRERITALPVTGDEKIKLTAADGPKFLEGLQYHLKSAYLRAGKPVQAHG